MNPCFGGDTAIIVVKLAQCATKRQNCAIILSGHASSLFRSWCLHRPAESYRYFGAGACTGRNSIETNTTTKLLLALEQYQKNKTKLSKKQILMQKVVEKKNKAGACTGTFSKIVKQNIQLQHIFLKLPFVAQQQQQATTTITIQ